MHYIKKYFRKTILIAIPLSIIIVLIIFTTKKEQKEVITQEPIEKLEQVKEEKIISKKFNIKGAVNSPGVYEFDDGERVIDAIEKSGGLLENANTSVINLSKNLFDEMVIVIYTNEEVNEMKEKNIIIQYVEKECNCPKLTNDACITSNDDKQENNNENEKNENKKISLNNASLEELQNISGIGKSKAEAIIKYREENNGFKDISELMNIKGIGESIFEKIKDSITI